MSTELRTGTWQRVLDADRSLLVAVCRLQRPLVTRAMRTATALAALHPQHHRRQAEQHREQGYLVTDAQAEIGDFGELYIPVNAPEQPPPTLTSDYRPLPDLPLVLRLRPD